MSDDADDPADASDEPSVEPEDPFDSFAEYRDREGDPFASLGEGGDAPDTPDDDPSQPAEQSDTGAGRGERDPFDYGESRGRGDSPERGPADEGVEPAADEAGAGTPSRADTDPLAGVDVSEGDPFESNASAFERTDIEDIDPDSVWERLTADPDADDPDAAGVAGGDPRADHDDVVEVSKHNYCEGCPHFSAPPDVACGHEGTEIIEFVDVDTVRIANCPVVEERRELEDDV